MRGSLALIVAASLASAARAAPDAEARFQALLAADAAAEKADSGLGEDERGIPPRLGDVTPTAQAKRLARLEASRATLDALPAKRFRRERQVDIALYRYRLDTAIAGLKFHDYEMPFNSDSSFWSGLGYLAGKTFRTEQDYVHYIACLRQVPTLFADETANMDAGLKRGFTPPKVTLAGREKSLDAVADAKMPEATALYAPFKTMPTAIPAARQAELRAEGSAAIRAVIPAYARLRTYLHDRYIPGARTTLAAEALPDGPAYYRAQIAEYATVDMAPEQIHAIGLAEVAKIRARMDGVIGETGFKGDFPAFLHFLRTDPRFYAKTPDELLKDAAWIAKRVDGKIGQYIGHLPRKRFAIVPVPADIAPFYTAGRGGDGVYLLNTYDLPSRPLFQLPALTLHESAPGHALQIPLAEENEGQLPFRRHMYISAYGEGWALYCETLGEEMGIYQTPYERFGMLSYQMWRAARLVVDTGIHAKGWTREQGQRFFHDNTALSDHEIETEVDRYISWPGQALSYYLGEMAIQRGRAKAEGALAAKFNIRAFHDMVLGLGSVTIPLLDAAVDRFIADGGKGPYPKEG